MEQIGKAESMEKSGFTSLLVDDTATLKQIYRLRVEVWRTSTSGLAEGAFPDGVWTDAHDAIARHWAIFDNKDRIVAAARLAFHDSLSKIVEPFQYERYGLAPQGLIAAPDRVVVGHAAQRQGLASRLLDLQDAAAVQAGATCALRQASPSMCRLLVKRGWDLLGPAISDPRFPGLDFTVAVKHFASRAEVRDAA
jgi:predicted GNAT family N-acyltransferase